MSPETFKQITAGFDSLVEVIALDRSCRTGSKSVRFGEDHGRSVISMNQTGRKYSDNSFFPGRVVENGWFGMGSTLIL